MLGGRGKQIADCPFFNDSLAVGVQFDFFKTIPAFPQLASTLLHSFGPKNQQKLKQRPPMNGCNKFILSNTTRDTNSNSKVVTNCRCREKWSLNWQLVDNICLDRQQTKLH